MNSSISFLELVMTQVHEQQALRYEQLFSLLESSKSPYYQTLIDTYQIAVKALHSIEHYLYDAGYQYQWGVNNRGIFLQFSYDEYQILNREMRSAMRIVYACKGDEFIADHVRLYYELDRPLPPALLQRYQHWVSK